MSNLGLISTAYDAETERLVRLGARKLRDLHRDKSRWTPFADIEGNEFDLIAGYYWPCAPAGSGFRRGAPGGTMAAWSC